MLQSLDGAFYRRLAVTAAALAAYRLGTQLPVPGLVTQSVAEAFKPVDLAVARLSIFALGITPLLSALILAEIVKIIAPTARRWEGIHYAVIVAALLLASVQGASIAGALQDVPNLVAEPGTSFRLVCTATLVAGAALVIALAAVIDRAGLGMGVWLIFLAPALAELPQNLAAIAQLYEVGQYSAAAIARSALFTAIATAGVVSIMLAAPTSAETRTICVWTLFIAYALLAWLLMGIGLAISGGSIDVAAAAATPGGAIRLVTLPAVIILIAWLYVRSYRLSGLPTPIPAAPIAAVLAAIALAAEILQSQLQTALPLGSVQLVVATVVATSILIDWGFNGGSERPVGDASEPLSPRA
jgi:preprotein translocase subunit SecY